MVTKEVIVSLLETNDRAIGRALLVLLSNQTATEVALETTNVNNGKGFTGFEGKIGTSMAKFYQKHGYLSPKQIAYWRKRDRRGHMRIGKYWKQLLVAAEAKAAEKEAA
jgi:hypothetical protein